jgi:hypothetical protein
VAVDDARDDERGGPDQPASLVPMSAESRTPVALVRRRGERERPPEGAARERERRGGLRAIGAFAGVVADRVVEAAPRVPVRDLATLRAQFPGLGQEEIADRLVSAAVKGSATVGAGVGAAAMLPTPPAMPAELGAELVGVALVELKLVAELHEVYGQRPPGNARQRATACLNAWASERGVDMARPATLHAALGGQLKRELRQRLLKRTVRSLPNLAPFMVGATVGAVLNRRDTRARAEKIRKDLRTRDGSRDALPPAAS